MKLWLWRTGFNFIICRWLFHWSPAQKLPRKRISSCFWLENMLQTLKSLARLSEIWLGPCNSWLFYTWLNHFRTIWKPFQTSLKYIETTSNAQTKSNKYQRVSRVPVLQHVPSDKKASIPSCLRMQAKVLLSIYVGAESPVRFHLHSFALAVCRVLELKSFVCMVFAAC